MNKHFDPLDPDTYHIDLDFTDDNIITIASSDYDFTNITISPSVLQVPGDAEFKETSRGKVEICENG